MSKLTLVQGMRTVELKPPYYPYQVTWRTGAYIQRTANGRILPFDPGVLYDNWIFDGNFRCTPAQAKTLGEMFAQGENINAFPEGFSMFGPIHGSSFHEVRCLVCEHGQIQENPYRQYTVRLVLEMVSILQTTAPLAQKLEGAFQVGSIQGLQMPTSAENINRAVRVVSRPGRNPSTIGTSNPSTDSTLSIEAREGNMGELMGYLESRRHDTISLVSQNGYFLFGAEIGNGTITARRTGTELIYSLVEHDHWRLDLPLNFEGIA